MVNRKNSILENSILDGVAEEQTGNKAEAYEAFDDIPLNPYLDTTIGSVIARRYKRRDVLQTMLGVTAIAALTSGCSWAGRGDAPGQKNATIPGFNFTEITAGNDQTHHVGEEYSADILLRWGDPIFADSPAFDPYNQTVNSQLRQFGYNNDFLGLVELADKPGHGVLCVNHEYTNEEVMFPKIGRQDKAGFKDMTRELVDIEMAAHGGSIVEIAHTNSGKWRVVTDSRYNRRITPLTTRMRIDGPAAGHKRMHTSEDPEGMNVIGTFNNCAGGITKWGTWLMAEENFHGYFHTDNKDSDGKPILRGAQAKSWKRYGVPGGWYAWGKYHKRFNFDREPNEPNRHGWVVEVDPLNPDSVPVKHTAMGRFRHEGASPIINHDGRVAVYMGDDARFDYLYKFISRGRYVPGDRQANMRLLSDGVLSVAKFGEDGMVDWLPLVWGKGPLTPENGFASQADVLIDTRLAADFLGATPMDRPEDVDPNEKTNKIYVMLTNNTKRKPGDENIANPRANNVFGHIIELSPPGNDHGADRFGWEILVRCGDPNIAEIGALWNPATSKDGWFASPDNCVIDPQGRLWVSTDQGSSWGKTGKSDGLYAVETAGALRGQSKLFFRCPVGGELCGPYFSTDNTTVFVAVQHPGTDGTKDLAGFARESVFEDPATRWPDFDDRIPPRPSVLAITRKNGGKIAL